MTRTALKNLCALYGWMLLPRKLAELIEFNVPAKAYDYTAVKHDLTRGVYICKPRDLKFASHQRVLEWLSESSWPLDESDAEYPRFKAYIEELAKRKRHAD